MKPLPSFRLVLSKAFSYFSFFSEVIFVKSATWDSTLFTPLNKDQYFHKTFDTTFRFITTATLTLSLPIACQCLGASPDITS